MALAAGAHGGAAVICMRMFQRFVKGVSCPHQQCGYRNANRRLLGAVQPQHERDVRRSDSMHCEQLQRLAVMTKHGQKVLLEGCWLLQLT